MAKYYFTYQCRPGMEQEYIKRHEAVWPEVIQALKDAGLSNFTTFIKGNQLFSFIEADNFNISWTKFQSNPDTIRWEKYMSEVLLTDVTNGEIEVIDHIVFQMD